MNLLRSATPSERLFGWLTLVALFAALSAIVGLPSVGLAMRESIRGNLAFALMVAAVLVDCAVLFSFGSTRLIRYFAKWVWIGLGFIALGLSLHIVNLNDPEAFKAADTVLLVVMAILAFPASAAGGLLIYFYGNFAGADHPTSAVDLLVYWVVLKTLGYAQWFMVIPALMRVSRRSAKAEDGG